MSRFLERQPVFRIIDWFHNERFRSWCFWRNKHAAVVLVLDATSATLLFPFGALIRFDGKTNLFHAQTIALPLGHLLSLPVHKNRLLIHKLFTAPLGSEHACQAAVQ